jgi:hypothetical protein
MSGFKNKESNLYTRQRRDVTRERRKSEKVKLCWFCIRRAGE